MPKQVSYGMKPGNNRQGRADLSGMQQRLQQSGFRQEKQQTAQIGSRPREQENCPIPACRIIGGTA
jgi:hypothetical protein